MCRLVELDLNHGCQSQQNFRKWSEMQHSPPSLAKDHCLYSAVIDNYHKCKCKELRLRIQFGGCSKSEGTGDLYGPLTDLVNTINKRFVENKEVKPHMVADLEMYVGRLERLPEKFRNKVDLVHDFDKQKRGFVKDLGWKIKMFTKE